MTEENGNANKYWGDLYLTVTEGPDKGRRHPLRSGDNVIGRAGTVRIDAEGVSRQHAGITVGEDLRLEDLGSTSGTMLNSRMLVGADYVFDGDEIRLGTVALRLTAKRREHRASIIGASLAIVIGLLLLLAALVFQDYLADIWRQRSMQRQTREAEATLPTWRDWNNLEYPSRSDLEGEGLDVLPATVMGEFNAGMRMYDDRMLEPGNAYQGIVHFKRALGLAELVPLNERPAIANRALIRMDDLQRAIRGNCDTKVFAYVRARQMGYWAGCYEALNYIVRCVPVAGDPYHKWAQQQITRLNVRFKQ